MSLPTEKIVELKQIIHSQLSQMNIQSRIKDVLEESIQENDGKVSQLDEQDLLDALRKKGVIDDLMNQMSFGSGTKPDIQERLQGQTTAKPATHHVDHESGMQRASYIQRRANVDPSRRYLYLQILGGKAFLEHLQEKEHYPGDTGPTFTLHVNFRGQRFRSRPVACACDPDIQEGFLLELHKDTTGDASQMIGNAHMMSICDQVHLVLIKTDYSGDQTLISSHFLEWRPVLAAPNSRCTVSVELLGIGSENKVPVGVLETRLELLPKTTQGVSEEVVTAQTSLERKKQAESERLFLIYAKQWWKEYLQVRETNRERLVKIFAQDENSNNRPVCSYLKPLRAGRLLDTPREAARFVSLIGYEKSSIVGGGDRTEQWTTMHAFLCRNKGDCEDHAVLLCCLLLGFGLDAYVCVGTKIKGSGHAWVMTVSVEGVVTFWESLTGHRYLHQPINPNDPPAVQQPKPNHPYRTVGCVFNHESFYANNQPSDVVEICHFNLLNESQWKAMSPDALRSVCDSRAMPTWPTLPPLCAPSLDPMLISNDIEQQMRILLIEHRRDLGLTTAWDDHLSYLLTQALSSYESERVLGVSAGNEEFQHAIRRSVPDGHTFKGYPIQFVHRNARRAFAACLKSPVCEEIINCRGDHVRLAVRVRVFTYPESATAVWIMFACKYKSVL